MRKILAITILLVSIGTNAQDLDKTKCEKVSTYSNGNIKKCKLKEVVKVDGHLCQSWIWFHENKLIKQCTTAESFNFGNYRIPNGSVVFLDTVGLVQKVWLSEPVIYDGIKCLAKNNEIEVSFHPNKNMKSCFLLEDQVIQSWPCYSSTKTPVFFYDSGRLKEFTLSENKIYAGKQYKKGDKITLDENGNVIL